MAKDNNIASQLQDLLVTQNFEPSMLGANGQPVNEPDEAKIFSFDYRSPSGKNYGTMVIVLGAENDMQIMYGDNLGRAMDNAEDREAFFDFQHHLRDFAHRRRWTVTPTDISRLKHVQSGLAAIKEGLFEGYYGTRQVSYHGQATEARLMIKHSRRLSETDARHRHVDSLFIETAEGERFKLPFVNLMAGRAMLEHVRQGGRPYDIRGNHITEMVTELKVLSRFRRAAHNRVTEGVTQDLVEQVDAYYADVRHNLQHMANPRGYAAYFETWHPAQVQPQEALVENIKALFVEQRIDDRIEAALPLLARIQQGSNMKEVETFENWIANLGEGTWALPETDEDQQRLKELMSQPLMAGPDGTNATEQLYDLIGDDQLFDVIGAIAQEDPDANIWDNDQVWKRVSELGLENLRPNQDQNSPDKSLSEGTCNMTAEGMSCPVHGLKECGNYMESMGGTVAGAVAPMEEGMQADYKRQVFDQILDGEVDAYDVMNHPRGGAQEYVAMVLQDMYDDVASDHRLHPDDDFEQILDIVVDRIEQDYGHSTDQGVAEDSTDPMDHRGAVTDSFYESELNHLKKLALAK